MMSDWVNSEFPFEVQLLFEVRVELAVFFLQSYDWS
jgi:hypothetical protein